ncbi:MAG: hypothetical protein J6S76_03970, partial [Clostridia bacterium]|nr:hypothetical protein [Clostridia bacterium]
ATARFCFFGQRFHRLTGYAPDTLHFDRGRPVGYKLCKNIHKKFSLAPHTRHMHLLYYYKYILFVII